MKIHLFADPRDLVDFLSGSLNSLVVVFEADNKNKASMDVDLSENRLFYEDNAYRLKKK